MKKKAAKFKVGQVIRCDADHFGKVESREFSVLGGIGMDGEAVDAWFYVMSCCPHARQEDEQRPLTKRERGE